jgi:hypothetical protein
LKFDDQLDEALRRMPAWIPPACFAKRVASRVATRDRSVDLMPHMRFWISATLQGTLAAAIGYLGSTIVSWGATSVSAAARVAVDEYLHVVLPWSSAQALSFAWMCAGLSLLIACMSTRRPLA